MPATFATICPPALPVIASLAALFGFAGPAGAETPEEPSTAPGTTAAPASPEPAGDDLADELADDLADDLAADLAADPFAVDLAIDLPIIGLTGAVFFGTDAIRSGIRWPGCLDCPTDHLGPLDRRVLDNHSRGAEIASDVLVYSALSAPFVVDFIDVMVHSRDNRRRGLRSWGRDLIVLAEVATVNLALTNTIKFVVQRPRPYSYGQDGSDRDPTAGDARLSFYSGHTSTAFAMATAYSYLFQARHPGSPWVAPVWVFSYGIASATGVTRVLAGKHFWSDVAVGAVAGAAIGLAIPHLHRRRPRLGARGLSLGLRGDRFGQVVALRGRF